MLIGEHLKPYIRAEEGDDLLFHLRAVGMAMTALPEVDVSPDPKDNPMLATTVAGNADLVVSSDKGDMLALEYVEGIPVVTAREAIGRLHRRPSE